MAWPTALHIAASKVPILVIGAGPSGLAASYRLSKLGLRPTIVEQSPHIGGLMRSIPHGDYIVDLGRKELYTRIPEVDALWHDLLGDDYRTYPHRVGSLYGGQILEMSGRFRGLLRGVPLPLLFAGGADLGRAWIADAARPPAHYEDYWYRRAGRRFAQAFAQGYWEKFRGRRWQEMAVPARHADGQRAKSHPLGAIVHGLKLATQGGPSSQRHWKHPARGSGQICERIAKSLNDQGIGILTQRRVVEIACADGAIDEVVVDGPSGVTRYRPEHVISSLQVEDLATLLHGPETPAPGFRPPDSGKRSVVLVYLFFDETPRFPHAWLEVNDRELACGRITNYAAFGGDMVPAGKTALCVEYFLNGETPPQRRSDDEWKRLAHDECARSRLIDPNRPYGSMVVHLHRCNAAASWREAQEAERRTLLDAVRPLRNLYQVNRPGTDWATFAGLMAAEAIATGTRHFFDMRADPTRSYAESDRVFRRETQPVPGRVSAP